MRALSIAGAFIVSLSAALQERAVLLRVISAEADAPLANAEVIDLRTNERTLTGTAGLTRLRAPRSGPWKVRVRQLGFAFADLELPLTGQVASDTVVVRLGRIPFSLPPVTTRVARDCPALDEAAGDLAYFALDQLRHGAERYDSFRQAYPFRVSIERRTVRWFSDTSWIDSRQESENSDRWGEKYSPGSVLLESRFGFTAQILFLANLGDPGFWDHHCPAGAWVEGGPNERQLRLGFAPAPHVGSSDWEGDAIMDSATSTLRRVTFRLRSRIAGDRRGWRDTRPSARRLRSWSSRRAPSRCGGERRRQVRIRYGEGRA